jgi:A/G-specific adenine glycosylase
MKNHSDTRSGKLILKDNQFSDLILKWYATQARSLPWRGIADPYAIWVSEIMLQQTRVETVIPYFKRWMERFPSIQELAAASLQEVLLAWEGLGYYGRARHMHKAAGIIIGVYNGRLPEEAAILRKLPGVGRYTAGAIASIAFGKDEPILDGNIRRVIARYFNVSENARSTLGEQELWRLVAVNLPKGHAGEYNQALMDLGASLCSPKSPDCPDCPVRTGCRANAMGIQELRPVVAPKPAVPHFSVTAAVIEREEGVLITRRPAKGLLGGMWEFPGGKQKEGEDLPACLMRELCEELGVQVKVNEQIGVFQHAYTHFRVTLYAFRCQLLEGEPQPIQPDALRWVALDDLAQFPMGKIDRQISKTLLSSVSL